MAREAQSHHLIICIACKMNLQFNSLNLSSQIFHHPGLILGSSKELVPFSSLWAIDLMVEFVYIVCKKLYHVKAMVRS